MRTVGSSASKYSARLKPNIDATIERGERLDPGVERAHVGVVEAPTGRDAVLGLGELGLELGEVLAGPQLRVGLGDGEQLAQRTGEQVLLLGLLGRRRCRASRPRRGRR